MSDRDQSPEGKDPLDLVKLLVSAARTVVEILKLIL